MDREAGIEAYQAMITAEEYKLKFEKGETDHGLAMGQAVVKTILELQLVHNKPIGLGIIGPGAQPEHIKPRLGPHATAAVDALMPFL